MTTIIGCGTGRCGTHSLQALLNAQTGVDCRHEFLRHHQYLPWLPDLEAFDTAWTQLHADISAPIAADVAFYWLSYVECLVDRGAHIICLQRDKEATVASMMHRSAKLNINNVSLDERMQPYEQRSAQHVSMPQFGTDKRAAFGHYWDLYYLRARLQAKWYPDNFQLVQLPELDDEQRQCEILERAGIATPLPIVPMPRIDDSHPKKLAAYYQI